MPQEYVQKVTSVSDDPTVEVLGAIDDAAVVAGALGTLSAKLRAISRDLIANIVLAAGANIIGKVGIDHSTTETEVVPTQILKTAASAGTPERLAADGTFFHKAILMGYQDQARTLNDGLVYIGPTSTNNAQTYQISPGEDVVIDVPLGFKQDLNDWFLDVLNDGDGVVIIYY